MTGSYVCDFARGYIAAGRPKDDTARRVAVARQHRAEAALHDANEDRQRLWERLNQVAAYAGALIAENASLRQEGANLRQHVSDLKARGEGLRDWLAEARRIAEH